MGKHDWVLGLLSEIEHYCAVNALETVATAISETISVAAKELDQDDGPTNVIYISDYLNATILNDRERVILAFSGRIEELLSGK